MQHQCLLPANSSLATVRRPNGWTDVTLPDANHYDRSQLGPKLPVDPWPKLRRCCLMLSVDGIEPRDVALASKIMVSPVAMY
jgi:hypothetical protein